ncbi:hypothetical protein Bca101_026661 [Brassica carinata]
MMHQMLQSQQIQAKALNQVTTDINSKMNNMFTELSTKYETMSNHIKRIDVQLVQTDETVKRQQENLRGKNVINPRSEHTNATELRCDKSEEKETEQPFAETSLGAEERTEHPVACRTTAPNEPTEIPPVRVYAPKPRLIKADKRMDKINMKDRQVRVPKISRALLLHCKQIFCPVYYGGGLCVRRNCPYEHVRRQNLDIAAALKRPKDPSLQTHSVTVTSVPPQELGSSSYGTISSPPKKKGESNECHLFNVVVVTVNVYHLFPTPSWTFMMFAIHSLHTIYVLNSY